jgi:hypothetical protein
MPVPVADPLPDNGLAQTTSRISPAEVTLLASVFLIAASS